ncbi:MAG TPA: phage baseplate assembly protein [Polyangiales bacterium]|nr:phage baseplate assembly protein [Polyangiales bacterium]
MLRARVDSMITRAVISRVNDALKTQRLQLQILADETVDDVEHMQPYGLSFVPPDGSEAIALAVSGARSHTVAICAQHPGDRPKGKAAKTGGLYTSGQWRLFIDADGIVHLGAESGAEFVALAQKVLDGFNAVKADLDGFKAKFDSHTHAGAFGGTGSAAALTTPPASAPVGTPLIVFPSPHTPASVAATKVKAT